MNKNLLLTTALVSATFFCQAQITKGATFLGGSLNYSSNKEETVAPVSQEQKNAGWNLQLPLGKAVRDNQIAGLFFNMGGGRSRSVNIVPVTDEVKRSGAGGGAFYRRYYPLGTRFYLFGEGSVGVNAETEKRETNAKITSRRNNTSIYAGLTPGLSFAVSKKLHLETALGNLFYFYYQWGKTEAYPQGSPTYITNNRQLFAGANISGFSSVAIGLRWILPSN